MRVKSVVIVVALFVLGLGGLWFAHDYANRSQLRREPMGIVTLWYSEYTHTPESRPR